MHFEKVLSSHNFNEMARFFRFRILKIGSCVNSETQPISSKLNFITCICQNFTNFYFWSTHFSKTIKLRNLFLWMINSKFYLAQSSRFQLSEVCFSFKHVYIIYQHQIIIHQKMSRTDGARYTQSLRSLMSKIMFSWVTKFSFKQEFFKMHLCEWHKNKSNEYCHKRKKVLSRQIFTF